MAAIADDSACRSLLGHLFVRLCLSNARIVRPGSTLVQIDRGRWIRAGLVITCEARCPHLIASLRACSYWIVVEFENCEYNGIEVLPNIPRPATGGAPVRLLSRLSCAAPCLPYLLALSWTWESTGFLSKRSAPKILAPTQCAEPAPGGFQEAPCPSTPPPPPSPPR